jgi:ribonuclease HII
MIGAAMASATSGDPELQAVESDAGPVKKASASARSRRRQRRASSGQRLFSFDRRLGVRFVAGADEAGRGCLAGPLVAAGVLFDYEALSARDLRSLRALNDSKQHSVEAREELYPLVLRCASRVHVVSRCARGIDARGLHKTNLAALRDGLRGVTDGLRGEVIVLVDGFWVADFGRPQRAIVEGDATSAAIAAASIVAKVTRDRVMRRMDALFPHYGFSSHVGYITPGHSKIVRERGPSRIHRRSFQAMCYLNEEELAALSA